MTKNLHFSRCKTGTRACEMMLTPMLAPDARTLARLRVRLQGAVQLRAWLAQLLYSSRD